MFNTYATLQTMNVTGINGIFQVASAAIPLAQVTLPALELFSLFIILSFASFYSTQRRVGQGDMPVSMSVAGLICVVVASIFSFIPNFESWMVLVSVIILEIIFVSWLFISRED